MSQRTELQGFLSVKIPPRTRGFLPWKTWKRQWISVRCPPSGGVDLILGRTSQNVLHVSSSDIIVRTQSKSHVYAFGIYPKEGVTANFCLAGTSEMDSQKWISTLRKLVRPPLLPVEDGEFMVSVIDNAFTRSSGFPGIYGILRVKNTGVTIIDPFTSKVVAHWLWCHISHLYVASTLNNEDRGRICTIITSREFPTGIGKIRLFCDEALLLIRNLTRGRCTNFTRFPALRDGFYRHHTFSHNNRNEDLNKSWAQLKRRPDSVKLCRRISKSESNLLSLLDQLDTSSECSDSGFIRDFYNSLFSACFNEQDGKNASEYFKKNESWKTHNHKDLESSESMHLYQELSNHEEFKERFSESCRRDSTTYFSRRQSGASVASGVYEEIDEFSAAFACGLNTVEEDVVDESPPPLPPRRNSAHKRECSFHRKMSTLPIPDYSMKYISKSAGSTPLPSPPSLSRAASSSEFFPPPWYGEEESHYLPMNSRNRVFGSSSVKKNLDEEEHYVVMSSFIKDFT